MYDTVMVLAQGLSRGERFSTAGIVTLQGMLTIFAVLAILWGAVELMHLLLHKGRKKTSKKQSADTATPIPNAQSDAAAVHEDCGTIVAVIMAAITAMREEEGCADGFRVVSFKRAQTADRRRRF